MIKPFGNISGELNLELKSILKYWATNTLDHVYGGFVGRRDHYNVLIEGASKGVVLNARILWTFATAYRFTNHPEYLELARRAFEYINEYFEDKQYGGLVWEVNAKGEPLNGRKQIYAQAFGIYGYSAYYQACKNQEALAKAIGLFNLIEKYSYDPIFGGYLEAFANDWSSLEDFRLSSKDANQPKSMNTHLHILEGYTNLLRCWPDKLLKEKTADLIRLFLDKIIDPTTAHFNLFFGNDWSVRSSIVSYGHDIEGAWLLFEAAKVVNDKDLLSITSDNLIRMVDVTMAEGCDIDGSVFNEKETVSGHLDMDKHWWMQAEAMVGLAYAWKISGKDIYPDKILKIWHFIQKTMIDRTNGEWFWRVNKNGVPVTVEDKAGFWKCPYHNSRSMMEVIDIFDQRQNN